MKALAVAPLFGLLAFQQDYVETRRMLPLLGDEAVIDAAVGDVDGDGDLDVFTARDGQNALLVNRGEGLYDDGTGQLPAAAKESTAVALGDLDGDGDLDAYVGNGYVFPGVPKDEILANDGQGSFTVAFDDAGGVFQTDDAEASDVDLDGDLDVVVTSYSAVAVALLRNTGAGLLLQPDPSAFTALSLETPDAALGDLDGDSDPDVLVAGWPGAYTLVNDGTGHFTKLPAAVGGVSVDLGDVDGDLDLDAYIASETDQLLLNDGAGAWSQAGLPPVTAFPSKGAFFADLDGDGDLDVVGAGDYYLGVYLLANDGAGAFTDVSSTTPYPFEVQTLVLLDADADLDADMIVFPPAAPPHLWLNTHGFFVEAQAQPSTDAGGVCAIGDVNGDHTPDLVSLSTTGGVSHPTKLLLNDGKAVFHDATATHMPPPGPDILISAELADADGDGDLDLALGFNGPDRWYRNSGAGVFTDVPGAVPVEEKYTDGLALADLDADGDVDQVTTYGHPFAPPPYAKLLLGHGDCTFFEPPGALVPANPSQVNSAPELADVDADGDLDLFLAGMSSELHANSGSAVFHHLPAAFSGPSSASGASSIAVGDVDGDGDVDAVLGGYAGPAKVHKNDGSGAFSLSATLLGVSAGTRLELVDEDLDGDLDLICGSPLELFRNNGSGTFALDFGTVDQEGYLIGLADLDGDLDVDLVLDDEGRLTVATRVAGGQVVWRSLPRAGKDQHLEVFGPAGTPYALAGSLGQASIPLPPFGTLLLDPATLVIAAGGSLPAGGVVSLKAPVPDDPSLIGVTVWWQAIAGLPLTLTNADRTTLSAF